jgi:hypothetical protein
MKYHINRSKNLATYLDKFGWTSVNPSVNPSEISDFSYWENKKTVNDPCEIKSSRKVWPKKYQNDIDKLSSFHKKIEDLKLTSLVPYTIINWRSPENRLSEDDFSFKDIWLMKEICGVSGSGINMINDYEEYLRWINKDINPLFYVLQKLIYDSHLIEDRKYVIRIYFLSDKGKLYIYRDGICYTTPLPLDIDYKDIYMNDSGGYNINKNEEFKYHVPGNQVRKKCHISHWLNKEDGKFKVKDNRKCKLLSHLREYDTIFRNIMENVSYIKPIFTDTYKKAKSDLNNNYHIWGVDYLVLPDLSVKLIEINSMPNLCHGIYRDNQEMKHCESEFRDSGFDRDLMRRLGYDLENKKKNKNGWLLVKSKSKNKQRKTKKKKKNNSKKR